MVYYGHLLLLGEVSRGKRTNERRGETAKPTTCESKVKEKGKKDMKKAVMVAAMAATLGLFAEEGEAYSLINNGIGGQSYIQINQDLDAFSFDVVKYENSALNGHAGYFVYSEDLSGKALENYVKANGVDIAKNQTTVNVGELKEGDKVGFYKWEKTGFLGTIKKTYDTEFMLGTKVVSHSTDWHGNVTETVLDTGTFVDYISGDSYQTGRGGWMKIEITATPAEGGPTGAPLPGALAVLLVGGLGAGAMKKARKRS